MEGIKIMSNISSFLIFSGNQDIWCSRTEEIHGVFWPLRRTHEISAPTSERFSRSWTKRHFQTVWRIPGIEKNLLTFKPLRVIRILFLLTLSTLNQTLRPWEQGKWSPTSQALDFWTNFPCQCHRKCKENSVEDMDTYPRVLGSKKISLNWI